MSYTDVINEYVAIIDKLEELRLLLQTKLIQLKAIDSNGLIDGKNPTFPKLLTKVTPTDIESITNKNLPNKPIDITGTFITDVTNAQYSITAFDSLMIDKFEYYRQYLIYQLKNMGVDSYTVDTAITIKNLILLLDKVEKIKSIDSITCDDELELFINQDNIINITILDETLLSVEQGTINIYENNVLIKTYEIGDDIIITPTTVGEHTYQFEYINTYKDSNNNTKTINKYKPSVKFPITFTVVYPPLEGYFTLQNVTTTSKYYTGNDDDFIGYENDKWDIDVNITDFNQQSINQNIPFNIYMYDDQHLITTGTTDSTGHIKLTNITIPYANSDFIDFRESAVTRYNYDTGLYLSSNRSTLSFADVEVEASDENNPGKAIIKAKIYQFGEPVEGQQVSFYITDEPLNNVITTNDVDKLSFIKNPTFVDGKLTYRRIVFTENNYLDDLNGCVTNIQQNGTSIQYTTFSTSEHTKLSEINNLNTTIGHLVTEVFYKTKITNNVTTITELDYETLTNKKYQYDKETPDYSVPLILKTTLEDPTHPNAELYHDINIYHVPFRIDTELTWYKTDPNIPSNITFVLYDEETDQPLDHLEQTYKLNINGTEYNMDSSIYNYQIDINALPYGETNLNVTLYENNIEFITLNKKITLLSNFELPSQTVYYANDTPDIYYKPKGNVTQNKQVSVNGVTKYTNAEGLLHDIKSDNTIGMYNLTLIASSDSLTEQRTFSYEIKEPFTITRTSYDQYSSVTYKITFHYRDIASINDYITITNENNNSVTYTSRIVIDGSNWVKSFYVTIDKNNDNVGTNTLTINANGYTESQTFEFFLYEHLYELITTEIELGYWQDIQIRCNDPDVNTVTISGTGISRNNSREITKEDDILTVNCAITQAAPNGTTLTMSYNDITETDTITIPKGNVTGSLFISDDLYNTNSVNSFSTTEKNNLKLHYRISHPLNDSITFVINDGVSNHSISRGNGGAMLVRFRDATYAPGTYNAILTFNGNNNFNAFTTSLTYIITSNGCTLTLAPLSDFLDTSHTSTTLTATYTDGNNQPINGATIDITTTNVPLGTIGESGVSGTIIEYNPKTTNNSGIATFTVNSVGTWRAYHKSGNTFYAKSNDSNIRGVVNADNTHIPNSMTLVGNKNILSYADVNEQVSDENNLGKSILQATIYDQHGDKIKNQTVNFYILIEEKSTVLSITAPTWIPWVGNNTTATVIGILTDDNNNILSNKPIKIYINNTLTDTQNTDSNGQITYTINNCANFSTIAVRLVYDGDSRHRSSEDNTTINVGANVYITGVD